MHRDVPGGWLLLSSSPINCVWAGQIYNDVRRSVTQLRATTSCPDAEFYVNVGGPYQFGIGYYDPRLLPRTRLPITSAGDLLDLPIGSFWSDDWLVVLTYAPSVGQLDERASALVAGGWTEPDFVAIPRLPTWCDLRSLTKPLGHVKGVKPALHVGPAWYAARIVVRRGPFGSPARLEAPFEGRDDEFRLLKMNRLTSVENPSPGGSWSQGRTAVPTRSTGGIQQSSGNGSSGWSSRPRSSELSATGR